MKIPVHLRSLLLLCVILSKAVGMAETIDPNKPLTESLLPDLLYFNFDAEDDGSVISQSELGLTASMETGHVDMPPTRRPGPHEIFGHALEFNYGDHPAFTDSNDSIAGNHLRIEDDPSLRLAGQSFTLGAWIQLPEDAELTATSRCPWTRCSSFLEFMTSCRWSIKWTPGGRFYSQGFVACHHRHHGHAEA